MKICGIICELNPLHNGHKYLFEQARKRTNADKIVALMSGNFVQRGEPAIVDERTRAEIALKCGADAVIELPIIYAVASSEAFARGAIRILQSVKATDIVVGVEDDTSELLYAIAKTQLTEEFFNMLSNSELPYPKAMTSATIKLLQGVKFDPDFINAFLHKPNNILAIEYIKASIRQNYNCVFEFIKRIDCAHAKDIRENFDESAKKFMPLVSFESVSKKYTDFSEQYSAIIMHAVRSASAQQISSTPDCAEGYENVIIKHANACGSLEELLTVLPTSRFTQNRIKRILIQTTLCITKEMQNSNYSNARLLGIKESSKEMLKEFSKTIISNIDFEKNLTKENLACYESEKRASQLYATIQKKPSKFYEKLLTV